MTENTPENPLLSQREESSPSDGSPEEHDSHRKLSRLKQFFHLKSFLLLAFLSAGAVDYIERRTDKIAITTVLPQIQDLLDERPDFQFDNTVPISGRINNLRPGYFGPYVLSNPSLEYNSGTNEYVLEYGFARPKDFNYPHDDPNYSYYDDLNHPYIGNVDIKTIQIRKKRDVNTVLSTMKTPEAVVDEILSEMMTEDGNGTFKKGYFIDHGAYSEIETEYDQIANERVLPRVRDLLRLNNEVRGSISYYDSETNEYALFYSDSSGSDLKVRTGRDNNDDSFPEMKTPDAVVDEFLSETMNQGSGT